MTAEASAGKAESLEARLLSFHEFTSAEGSREREHEREEERVREKFEDPLLRNFLERIPRARDVVDRFIARVRERV